MLTREGIIKYFAEYTNEQIKEMIVKKSAMFSRLLDSEKISKIILCNHARPIFSRNESFKYSYYILIECAKLRNIRLDDIICSEQATVDDILARIEENRAKEVDLIDEYCYKYDGYCGKGLWNKRGGNNGMIGADIKINEVNELYDSIVEETKDKFANRSKKKVKQKR